MRAIRNSVGQINLKRLAFKVFAPGNKRFKKLLVLAPHRKAFTPQGVDDVLSQMATRVEESFPEHDYRFVPIGTGEFNFVHEDECAKCRADQMEHGKAS